MPGIDDECILRFDSVGICFADHLRLDRAAKNHKAEKEVLHFFSLVYKFKKSGGIKKPQSVDCGLGILSSSFRYYKYPGY